MASESPSAIPSSFGSKSLLKFGDELPVELDLFPISKFFINPIEYASSLPDLGLLPGTVPAPVPGPAPAGLAPTGTPGLDPESEEMKDFPSSASLDPEEFWMEVVWEDKLRTMSEGYT
jgi:hypothetical protein